MNLEIIITILSITISFIITIISLILKLIKNKNNLPIVILEELLLLMKEAESYKSLTGKDKEKYVLDKLNELEKELGITISNSDAQGLIEILIDLTNNVNKEKKHEI